MDYAASELSDVQVLADVAAAHGMNATHSLLLVLKQASFHTTHELKPP
ncbi:MAG TPA: hypothetical protein V6D20_09595 [Candidatus Obscuribacterales bacterium]